MREVHIKGDKLRFWIIFFLLHFCVFALPGKMLIEEGITGWYSGFLKSVVKAYPDYGSVIHTTLFLIILIIFALFPIGILVSYRKSYALTLWHLRKFSLKTVDNPGYSLNLYQKEIEKIKEIVEKLSLRLHLQVPRIGFCQLSSPAVIGGNERQVTLLIPYFFLKWMKFNRETITVSPTDAEIEAIMFHELTHIQRKDIHRRSWSEFILIPNLKAFLLSLWFFSLAILMIQSDSEKRFLINLLEFPAWEKTMSQVDALREMQVKFYRTIDEFQYKIVERVGFGLVLLIFYRVVKNTFVMSTRIREYLADADTHDFQSTSENLISALEKISSLQYRYSLY